MFKSCFVSLAVLVLTEATPLALNIAHPNTLAQIRNSTDLLSQSFNASSIECDGHEYGQDLQYDSCDNVANHQMIPLGPETFAPRWSRKADVPNANCLRQQGRSMYSRNLPDKLAANH